MLTVRNLTFGYDKKRPVLQGVDLLLPDGQIGVLLGKNGAGKSTLFKCLLGLIKGQGQIVLDDKDLGKMRARDRATLIGYVPQDISFGDLTVSDCVMTGRLSTMHAFCSPEDRQAADEAIRQLGLEEVRDHEVSKLSGGERQKVAVARALASDPKLLVFDEPTGNLDIANERLVLSLAKNIANERGISVLIAVHNLQFAFSAGDVFYMMKDGVIAHQGGPEIVNEETILDTYGIHAQVVQINDKRSIVYEE